MKVNRVLIVTGVILIAAAFYELRLKPQSRPLYERALALYRQESYHTSLLELERAYQIEPNSTAILVLLGWNHLKLRHYNDARANFDRAARLNPELVEAQLGLAYTALETGQGEAPVAAVRTLLSQYPDNLDFRLLAAGALRQGGYNLEAQKIFESLLGRGKYGQVARKNLEEMYGLEGLDARLPQGLPPLSRPEQMQVNFRARGQYLQLRQGNAWENFYIKGINLSPALPGQFLSEASNQVSVYRQWLEQMVLLGVNTVRVNAALPPAFYRALKQHNETPNLPKLYLIQGVWLVEPQEDNLFAPATEDAARQQIARVIDLIHGQGDLPARKGHASGLYPVDVSDYVVGLSIGRELEPHLVIANNEQNSFRKSHPGRYVSIENGNATEVWLAIMVDYAASYETEKYNHQRPLGMVNWPPLDPLSHPTEAGYLEEVKFRRNMGEKVGPPPPVIDDEDAVSLDDTRFQAQSSFPAGLFASYPVYPFYPDFLLHEPALLQARDHVGPNSFFGYLKALKAHYAQMPLLISEYGIPTSIGISHFHPLGWNQGGLSEREQGDYLARMTRNIADAGCAGGAIFQWQDQWFATNWLTAPLEVPEERRALWLNALNPRESFGIWTYEGSESRLFSSDPSPWRGLKPLYEKSSGPLRSLATGSDEAFLYLRLSVDSLPRGRDGAPQLEQTHYLIGISTYAGHFGSRILPGLLPHVRYPQGFNFLLHVAGSDKTRLLVASNYNPYGLLPIEGVAGRMHLDLRRAWKPALEDWSPMEEIVVEPNRMRFGRDGTVFPNRRYSRSLLRYSPVDSRGPQDSLATWSADFQNNALLFRLPWGLLFVTDPSARQVYNGTAAGGQVNVVSSEGMAVVALSFRPGNEPLNFSRFPYAPLPFTDSLPAADGQGVLTGVPEYRWEQWETVKLEGRLKAGARTLQAGLRELRAR